jgi:hypothetical protein
MGLTGMLRKPGRQASRSEQLLLTPLIKRKYPNDEVIIIHHITEDTPYRLQLEIERRFRDVACLSADKVAWCTRCIFERITL